MKASVTEDARELELLQTIKKSLLSSNLEQRLFSFALSSNPFLRNIVLLA